MMKTILMRNRGFTLMELLVVIAIIGLLASVVLASLNTARQRGADAAVKSNLSNARPQAELYYDTTGDYDDVCTAAGGVSAMVDAANGVCGDAPTAYAIKAPLSGSAGAYYCVDSAGAAETYPSGWASSTVTACP